MTPLYGKRWWLATGFMFLGSFAILAPSVGDFGYTYDEPAYRHSQTLSIQWWQGLKRGEFRAMLDPDALLYYWPYGRYGINFHPPLAGQLNLASCAVFGLILKDIPARRMASVLEFTAIVTLLFGFLAKRYGVLVGFVAGCSLLFMPRLFGQAHLIDTDMPGLLLWAATSFAFWKGLHEPEARGSRITVGILIGLAFVEKMGAVIVILPLVGWLVCVPLRRAIRTESRASWRHGILMTAAMGLPLGVAFMTIRRLAAEFLKLQVSKGVSLASVSPARTDLFRDHPQTSIPGAILLLPLAIWGIDRMVAHCRKRPVSSALEIWLAILAFGPAIAWIGNPAWWREAMPRLAHYYAITTTRQGVLPDIQVLYFGQIYEYSLPWHNGFVLMAITVPVSILIAASLGVLFAPWRDRLPLFFLSNLLILPIMRMLPTPAHDGVRLFLPTFFFLAAFAGWGVSGLARRIMQPWASSVLCALVLIPAAWGLIRIHPYELSYYNEAIGGPAGAWRSGFELSYWYDAFTNDFVRKMNRDLPDKAVIAYANKQSEPLMVPSDQQSLGILRPDLRLDDPDGVLLGGPFRHVMLLTHDSKSDAFSKLLFALKPMLAEKPKSLGNLRVASVYDPKAASVAWALQLLLDKPDTQRPDPPSAPEWIRRYAPIAGRFWDDGLKKAPRLGVEMSVLDWAKRDPDSLRAAAKWLAARKPLDGTPGPDRLAALLGRYPARSTALLRARPAGLVEAVEIVINKPEALRQVLLRQGYTDLATIGGHLDASR